MAHSVEIDESVTETATEPVVADVIGTPAGSEPAGVGVRQKLVGYLMLTKPRIIILLLITTIPAMIVAAGGMPSVMLMINTLIGGTLAAGGANAVNCYVDRDIDEKMARTRKRPVPAGTVAPTSALIFGLVLGAISFAYLTLTVNLLAAVLALGALGFYAIVYTLLLKRSTAQNIVIGGAAGAAPVLVGWAAVRNSLSAAPIIMFLIVFYWTPPHFWALAIKYKDDYAAVGVPMLPVTRGVAETTRYIVLYSWQLVAVTLLLYPAAQMGIIYLLSAIVLDGIFMFYAYRLRAEQTIENAMALFKFSIYYLGVLFVMIAVDVLVRL